MPRPRGAFFCRAFRGAAMDLQRELRHKSEDIDDLVLLDVVKALRRRVRRWLTHEIVEKALLDELRLAWARHTWGAVTLIPALFALEFIRQSRRRTIHASNATASQAAVARKSAKDGERPISSQIIAANAASPKLPSVAPTASSAAASLPRRAPARPAFSFRSRPCYTQAMDRQHETA